MPQAIDPQRWKQIRQDVDLAGNVAAVYTDGSYFLFALGTVIDDPEGSAFEWHTISEPVKAGNVRAAK